MLPTASIISLIFSCLNIANVIWIACYLVKDVLLLRILAVVAMLIILPHYLINNGDYGATAWNLIFIAINVFWIVVILRDRRPPKMTATQSRLYELTFHSCTKRQMLALLEVAEAKAADVGSVILQQGTQQDSLILIVEGAIDVRDGARRIARLGEGSFVGEMSFLTGSPASADIIAKTPVQYLHWQTDTLEKLMKHRADLQLALKSVLGINLVDKLAASTDRLPSLTTSVTLAGGES